jgi:hypothetical protein
MKEVDMRKANLLVMSLFLAATAGAAEESFLEKRSGYIEYDYLLPTNAFRNSKSDLLVALSPSFPTATASSKLTPGPGAVRLGAYMGWEGESNLDLGASIGYVRGPESTVSVTLPSGVLVDRMWQRVEFLRFTIDGRATLPVSEGFKIRFKAGAGVAMGLMNGTFTLDPTACMAFVTPKLGPGYWSGGLGSDRWVGLTWEAGPSLAWTGKRTDLEISGLVMGLPGKGEVRNAPYTGNLEYLWSTYPAFSWTTWGVGVSIHFKPQPVEEETSL